MFTAEFMKIAESSSFSRETSKVSAIKVWGIREKSTFNG
jgi:hypothetical protein